MTENGSTDHDRVILGEVTEDAGPIVDKAALLSGRAFGVTSVPIPGLGVIKIRPLSRAEALKIHNRDMDAATMEQTVISLACVEPTFTKSEVAQWQASSAAGEMVILIDAILEKSGMDLGAGKAAYKQFRGSA